MTIFIWTGLIWAGALLLLFVSTAAYIPKSIHATDLPSHFILQSSIGAALLMFLSIAFHLQGKIYLVLLISYFLCIYQMWPMLLKRKKSAGPGTSFKILQANTWVLNRKTTAFQKLIHDEKPDMIMVAEVNSAFARLFQELQAIYPHQHIRVSDDSSYGVAILSKTQLHGFEEKFLTPEKIPSLFFHVKIDSQIVHVASLHTANPLPALKTRDAELAALVDWHEKTSPQNLLILGDLNATPYCRALKNMTRRMNLKNARDGRGVLGSFPARAPFPFLRIPIDHLLVGGGVKIDDFRLGPHIDSDHLPTLSVIRV